MAPIPCSARHGTVLTTPTSARSYIAAALFETLLYGTHLSLFCICLFSLTRRKTLHWVLLLSATAMFALATAHIGLTLDLLFKRVLEKGLQINDLRLMHILSTTNSFVADTLLLYRCSLFWGKSRWIIIGPAFLLALTTGCGYTFSGTTLLLAHYAWVGRTASITYNVVTSTLAIGRILWLSRVGTVMWLGEAVISRYNIAALILLETSLLYTMYMIFHVILSNNAVMNVVMDAGLIQVVGIIPTLDIILGSLGATMQDVLENQQLPLASVPTGLSPERPEDTSTDPSTTEVFVIGRASFDSAITEPSSTSDVMSS